jgi:hypothetical protein
LPGPEAAALPGEQKGGGTGQDKEEHIKAQGPVPGLYQQGKGTGGKLRPLRGRNRIQGGADLLSKPPFGIQDWQGAEKFPVQGDKKPAPPVPDKEIHKIFRITVPPGIKGLQTAFVVLQGDPFHPFKTVKKHPLGGFRHHGPVQGRLQSAGDLPVRGIFSQGKGGVAFQPALAGGGQGTQGEKKQNTPQDKGTEEQDRDIKFTHAGLQKREGYGNKKAQ